MLTHYAMKSANDNPKRDPKQWQLIPISENGFPLVSLHENNDDSEQWTDR